MLKWVFLSKRIDIVDVISWKDSLRIKNVWNVAKSRPHDVSKEVQDVIMKERWLSYVSEQ